jgi:lactoylglutathione lyase
VTSRPFRVLGVQQVAVGGLNRASLERLWIELLGLPVAGRYKNDAENVDELRLDCGGIEIDLMQPVDSNAKPKVHEPALNHIALWIDDLPAAVRWLEAQGVRFAPGGIRKGASGHDVCFIHPKGDAAHPQGGEGVLIELVQA